MELREYQIEAKKNIKNEFKKGNKAVILVIPTGGGKTVVFVDIAKETANKGKKVMIICDRKELIKQASAKINIDHVIIAPGHFFKESNIYVASIDTLINRDLPIVDLIILDECHKQTFDKVFDMYPEAYVIGATATPVRTGNMKPLSQKYQALCEIITTEELITKGFLESARYFCAKNDFSDLNTIGGEINQAELFKGFNKKIMYDGLIDNYRRFSVGDKSICFCVSQEHSDLTAESFRLNGISAESLTSKMSDKERDSLLLRFSKNEFDVLCNCGILTTGYDEPSIKTVIINRDTLSLSLFLQMCGRGSRPFLNKKGFKIIDQGANLFRFGLWHQPRIWSLDINKKKKSDDIGAFPVKACPACESLIFASARTCQYCNYIFPEKEKELYNSDFIEFGTAPILKASNGPNLKELKDIAKKRGYSEKWAYVQYNLKKIK